MGLCLDTSIKEIQNTWGHEHVDMGIKRNGRQLALGFRKNGELLELRGDFYGTGLNESQFMDQLSQKYTKNDIVDKITNQSSYVLEGEPTVNENGEIEIYAYQFA